MDDRNEPRPESRTESRPPSQPESRPHDDRRAFLLKVAKGTVYAAPIIRTLAAPDRLYAIDPSAFMMGMLELGPDEATGNSPFGQGPGTTPPPWSGGPPGGGGPGGEE